MAHKKSRKKSSQRAQSQPKAMPPMMDRRAMEKSTWDINRLMRDQEFGSIEEANAFLEKFTGVREIPVTAKSDPLEKAQDVMYEAWNAQGRRRVELAHKALEISKDCADAYVLLAEETARSLEEAKNLYEKGVKAGERALGPELFEENVGHFWGIIETRPYMRAREGLAQCLWLLGQRRQAIAHYQDMLRLNPGDNQGIRYTLAHCLLHEGLDAELGQLLDQHKEDTMADWLYTRALWLFRREGASDQANAALKEATAQNHFVPHYLLGHKSLPQRLPDYVGWGDESEAVSYAAEAIELWRKTPGALEWLFKSLHGGK